MIGWSDGFTFRNVGGDGMLGGSRPSVAEIPDWTSSAAPSMSRERSNSMVTFVEPWVDVEFIDLMPAMFENSRSRTVATEAAIVSGLAPGRLARTEIVGKSTTGRSDTGRDWYAKIPNAVKLAMTSVVMTGLRMKGAERFISRP